MRAQRKGLMRIVIGRMVLLVVGLHVSGTAALAGPEGATVVHGTATFQQSGNYTTIQASDRAIINYSSFDIARPETVEFIQPSASASVLNRILSANPTLIDGTILANGRVFFVNPAGVIFGESAQVNVAQLVASALNISDADFINGHYNFQGGEGSVINKGSISAEQAYLIGKQVANLGNIDCPGGYVVMVAGDRVFLGEPGTNLLVEIDESALSDPSEPIEGSAVLNEGTVDAAGGSIILAAAGDIYAHAISNVGRLSASASKGDAGTVKLSATEGTVVNTGSIEAVSESGEGGQVQVLGDRVGLFESSEIDVSGAAGGGTALVGGDYKGQGDIPTASRTSVGANATIRADATEDGDGGEIIIWSEEITKFYGHASATGAGSGDGGLVEVSGKQDLSFAGTVALGAAEGSGGTLLLDPATITIADGGEDASPQDDLGFSDNYYQITISEVTLENTAAGGNAEIVLEATNDIVMNDLSDDALTLSPGVSLVLRTRNNPAFQEPPSGGIVTSDSIIASGGGNLTLQGGHDGTSFVADSTAHIHIGSLVTDGGSVTVQSTGEVSLVDVTTVGADNAAGGDVLLEAGLFTASRYMDVHGSINTSGGADADASGANPAGSVRVSGGTAYIHDIIAVGGDDNGSDAQGGAGGSVFVGAPTQVVSQGDIRTSGGSGSTEGDGGDVTFNGALVLADDLTVTAGNADVVFDGTVNDDGNSETRSELVVNSGGTTQFNAGVGGSYPIASITTDAPGTTEINANVATAGDEEPPESQVYNDPVVLGGDLALTDGGTDGILFNGALTLGADAILISGGDVTFQGAVDDDGVSETSSDLVVNSPGTTRFSGVVGNTHPLDSITTDEAGTTEIGANITTDWWMQYDDPVVLTGDVTLTNWGTPGICFSSAVSDNGEGPWDLTLAGPGSAEFLDTVTLGGGDLIVTAGWYITTCDIVTTGVGDVDGGNVSLVAIGGDVSVNGTIDTSAGADADASGGNSAGSVTIESQNEDGTVSVGDITATGGDSLVTYTYEEGYPPEDVTYAVGGAGGSISLSAENIAAGTDVWTTAGGVGRTTFVIVDGEGGLLDSYDVDVLGSGGSVYVNGAVTLGGDLTLSGAGDVTFEGTIDDDGNADTSSNLAVNSAGTTQFGGVVGGTYPIDSLTTDAAGTTRINANITTGVADGGGTAQTYNDSVVLTPDVTLTLTDHGTTGIFFNGTVAWDVEHLLFIDVVTTDAAAQVQFDDAVTFAGILRIETAGGDVTFQGTVDGAGEGMGSILRIYSAGDTWFNAAVGGIRPIGCVDVYTYGEGTTRIGADITTAQMPDWGGTQIYYGPVVLTNSVTLTDEGYDGIFFNNTVSGDGEGAWDLTVVTTDPSAVIQFDGGVDLDGGLSATAAGDIWANQQLTSATNNIKLRSTEGNLLLQGDINADRDAGGNGGGVSLIAEAGRVGTYIGDGIVGDLNITITGYSERRAVWGDGNWIIANDTDSGVDIPYTDGKAAICIQSQEPLVLGSDGGLVVRGSYNGDPFGPPHREEFGYEGEHYTEGWLGDYGSDMPPFYWVVDVSGGEDGYATNGLDERPAVGFSTEWPSVGGVPIDVGIYLQSLSTGTSIDIDCPLTLPDRATAVLDGFDTIRFGETFMAESTFADTSRLEVVSRIASGLSTEADRARFPYDASAISGASTVWPEGGASVIENANPEWFTGYSLVQRGGSSATLLATGEHWYSYYYVPYYDLWISGTDYLDHDGDGVIDSEDTGLPEMTIFIDMDDSGTWTDGDLTTTTGMYGEWGFNYRYYDGGYYSPDIVGQYVYEVVPAGYVQTLGQEGYWIHGDGSQSGLDFANYLLSLPIEEPPLPPPLPVVITPVVVPVIPTEDLEDPDWIRQAEKIIGTIVPPHPECMDVKEEDIDILRKCQVACDLFSTDVSLNVVAEDLVSLHSKLVVRVKEIVPRLDRLSQKWVQPRPEDIPTIEEALRQDQITADWLHDAVKFVTLMRTKLGKTTRESSTRFVEVYLARDADAFVRNFVRSYVESQLALMAGASEPIAQAAR